MDGEMREGRKIQFSVPSATPIQLDPRQVEMIRRRRPTPAMLFRTTEHPSPEDEHLSYSMFACENGVLRPKMLDPAVYQPPSLTAVQKMVQAHIKSPKVTLDSPSSESSDNEEDVSPDPDTDSPNDSNPSAGQHLEQDDEEEDKSNEDRHEKHESTEIEQNTQGKSTAGKLESHTSPQSLIGEGKGKKEAENKRTECETSESRENGDRKEKGQE